MCNLYPLIMVFHEYLRVHKITKKHITSKYIRHLCQMTSVLGSSVLKECSSEIAPVLALVYNESLAQGTVPDERRQANVARYLRRGGEYSAASYKPVSLNCICCKILKHILVRNINKHIAFESILTDCQHGFRSQWSWGI